MSDETGYNGWTNYETWTVELWIDNEEASYNACREMVAEAKSDAELDSHPLDAHRSAQGILADALKSKLEEAMPDLGASVWSDLLNAAFSEVDFYEIAENLLREIAEESSV